MTNEMQLRGNWNYPTAIRFGAGRIGELPNGCRELGMRRPLLVTDAGMAGLPMIDSAVAACCADGLRCKRYADVQGNPVEANVTAGVTAYRRGSHDGVIAFGGGSALDVGKAVALMVGQTRPIWDFEDRDDWYTRVNVDGMAPVVAVPTTSGTGSEVGRASVITDDRDHTKKIIFHPRMLPALVIADPELTVGLPPDITAAVGMDALSHNLEAFCSPIYHPMAQGVAIEGMRLIKEWLPVAFRKGSDIDARAHMMAASTMGAAAFQKGLGGMHAMSHPCGAVLNTHHGLTNAVVMPYVLAFNRTVVDSGLTDLARYLDLPEPSFRAVLDWLLELREALNIPTDLAALGVTDDHIGELAEMAAADPSVGGNPVALTVDNLTTLFSDAVHGRLAV
jgi:alcohol dehydrogenase class IV